MTLRLMRKGDLKDVLILYDEIYTDWEEKEAQREIQVPESAVKTLAAYLEADPHGCFVLEKESMFGFAFSHRWGRLGWLGPLGVLEGERGKGYGRKLTEVCVKYLKSHCTTIGLETVSAQNIGLYMKLGFFSIFPRLRFFKNVERKGMSPDVKVLSETFDRKTIVSMSRICSAQEKGLDYVGEILSYERHGVGKTLLLEHEEKIAGFAFLQTLPSREEKRPLAMIKMLAIHPRYTKKENLFSLLDACEALAHKEGREEISIKVYCGYRHLVHNLLAYGYNIQSATLRMILQGNYEVDENLFCGYAWSS